MRNRQKDLNAYMPSVADSMPVPNLLARWCFGVQTFGDFSTPSPLRRIPGALLNLGIVNPLHYGINLLVH